jgi:hypothetical protein
MSCSGRSSRCLWPLRLIELARALPDLGIGDIVVVVARRRVT